MAGLPSVVLLDDGELDRVRVILERLGAQFTLCRRAGDARDVPRARDLLVTSGRRALAMPELGAPANGEAGPIWLCVHGQDFEGLRSELRARGVHYLVHSAVDQETLRLLIEMLLSGQRERRTVSRLPVGCEATLRHGKGVHLAKLLDLSRSGARLRWEDADLVPAVGETIELELPLELHDGALGCLVSRVVRAEPARGRGGREGWAIGVEFRALSPEAAGALDRILSGSHPATRVSALATPQKREGRRAERRAYRRRIAALAASDAGTPRVVLGHDLSVAGIRIARQPGLRKGMTIALGLYGADGGSPITIEAEITADQGPRGLGLAFRKVTDEQRRALEKLVAVLPLLESLDGDAESEPGVVLSRVVAQKA